MTVRTLTTALFTAAVVLFASAANAAPSPAPAPVPVPQAVPEPAQDPSIQGNWSITSVTFEGETQHAPAGAMVFAFEANGRVSVYIQGRLADEGRFHADGENLEVMLDSDKVAEYSSYRVENGTLVITREVEPGKHVVITLTADAAEEAE